MEFNIMYYDLFVRSIVFANNIYGILNYFSTKCYDNIVLTIQKWWLLVLFICWLKLGSRWTQKYWKIFFEKKKNTNMTYKCYKMPIKWQITLLKCVFHRKTFGDFSRVRKIVYNFCYFVLSITSRHFLYT